MTQLNAIFEAARVYMVEAFGQELGMQVYSGGMKIDDPLRRRDFFAAAIKDVEAKRAGARLRDLKAVKAVSASKFKPVSLRQFVEDPYFLNMEGVLYDEVLRCTEEMNNGLYQEAVLTGAIGTGKTTIALVSIGYQLYLLSGYTNPQEIFGLDPSSEIVFIFQSLNASLAKSVDFARFKAMIEKSPYFTENFKFSKDIVSELQFPNRIIVKPVSGSETGAIGQNVIGGIIDEINFMSIVENSKSSVDGGTYDQAIALYNSIARRRKSRFMAQGKLPGLLCLVSSKRYPGQFTDQKEEESLREIELTGKTTIYVYDKRTWDIKPPGSFSGNWFSIFIGDGGRKPRILLPDEELDMVDLHLIVEIPEEYRMEFEKDMMNSLRDIAGISTLATHPFIVERDKITAAIRKDHVLFGRDKVDFVSTKLEIIPSRMFKPELPRFAHIDLAVTGDSAGFAIGTVTGFTLDESTGGETELMPQIWMDATLEINPPKGGEIQFHKVREVLYALKKAGMNIKWVTFDTFQSVDSMQLLRQAGFSVGTQSVDVTTHPYDFTKNALYSNRLSLPEHPRLMVELASLEKDTKKNKIDHPPHGSKDIADSVAGVVYGLTMRREIWTMYGIPMGAIPKSVIEATKKDKMRETE